MIELRRDLRAHRTIPHDAHGTNISRRGEALLLPPTVVCCEQVAAAPTAAEFLAAPVTVAPVMPRPVEVDGVVMMRSELPV